jgi:hypothetical protein
MKKLASLALLVLVASCNLFGGDDGGDTAIVGTWTLQSVNGDPLPANFQDGEFTAQITAGTAVVSADGTFSYSETWDGESDITSGTWTKSGDTYTFQPNELVGENTQVPGYATVSGNTMTLTITEVGMSPTTRILTK